MESRLILVVDDDEAIRALIADLLTGEGYRVESAGNGADALLVMARVVPTLILLDLNMAVLDGFGFVAALVALGLLVPTVLVSTATDLPLHAAELEAVAFIRKPFDIAHLLATVARHCTAT